MQKNLIIWLAISFGLVLLLQNSIEKQQAQATTVAYNQFVQQVDDGKIQIIDSPQNMKNALGNEVITITIEDFKNNISFLEELKKIEFIKKINTDESKITLFASNGTQVIPLVFKISSKLDVKISSIALTQPTLDDVFISYTGHEIRDADSNFNRKREHAKIKRLRA